MRLVTLNFREHVVHKLCFLFNKNNMVLIRQEINTEYLSNLIKA